MADEKNHPYNGLTPEEEDVILTKGTERPFSGQYYQHNEEGVYTCKRCNAILYKSDDKFDSRCGWPSFDDAIPGAITQTPDTDGMRTEIVCSNCGGHLGHVFFNEGFTDKNARHCVNSISLDFTASGGDISTRTAYFAGGCFWGTEYYFHNEPGVISTDVGYIGGHQDNPTYEAVCSGNTGHAEAVEVVYDPSQASYENLARLFFEIHDPTQVNRQGPDIGEQYRSAIFYSGDNERKIAEKLINILETKGYKIATEITEVSKFWKAEQYHQDYFKNTGNTCHLRTNIWEIEK
ncbi:MAG: bifunctional methionine sulfoxide reductase B/A protein [candidate division Zixibacteria bacterium]|nr:bifunctional methionine sulfoxide reductase B/A protein [candidate division Zixibacteria bacterium]